MTASTPDTARPLAAVVYRSGEGQALDRLLAEVAEQLAGEGYRLAGAVQSNAPRPGRCACDMTLKDLASGRSLLISQDRGPEARGCHLDPQALEELAGLCQSSIGPGIDLVLLNKFGKHEVEEGGGFRPLIEAALDLGIPVLVGLNAGNLAAFRVYAGEYAVGLQPRADEVMAWCRAHLARPAPRYATGAAEAAATC